jgi:hypothetical protein
MEPGKFLVPANATTKKPPMVEVNQKAVFENGQLVACVDFRGMQYWLPDGTLHTITKIGDRLPEDAVTADPVSESDRHLQQIHDTRRRWYQQHVDPMIMESIIKRAQGLDVEADDLIRQAIAEREAIQIKFPLPEFGTEQ